MSEAAVYEEEPLRVEIDKWDVTARTQRSRITLYARPDPFAALQEAVRRVMRGENDDEYTDEPGPVLAS